MHLGLDFAKKIWESLSAQNPKIFLKQNFKLRLKKKFSLTFQCILSLEFDECSIDGGWTPLYNQDAQVLYGGWQ